MFDPVKWLNGRDFPLGDDLDELNARELRVLARYIAESRNVGGVNGTYHLSQHEVHYIMLLHDLAKALENPT
jgi:hypothetical protein